MYLPIWTVPGKVWLSVRTVKPFGRFVTLYSGALSKVSIGLSLYIRNDVSNRVLTYLVLKWLQWVEFGNRVGVSVGVNGVEDSVENSWVGSKSGSLLKIDLGLKMVKLTAVVIKFLLIGLNALLSIFVFEKLINSKQI